MVVAIQPSWSTDFPKSRSERGAALLVVLATFVVTIIAVTLIAEYATNVQTRRRLDHGTDLADALLPDVERVIVRWLRSASPSVVLSDAAQPLAPVFQDQLDLDGMKIQARVTAFDQCGMVPLEMAQKGSPLRLTLDEDVLRVVDRLQVPRGEVAGLDLFLHHAVKTDAPIFPRVSGNSTPDRGKNEEVDRGGIAIGALVATHSNRRINVNTAPLDVVESAFRMLRRGGIEAVRQSRSTGLSTRLSTPQERELKNSGSPLPELVSASESWSFRVDLLVGRAKRAWWCIYEREGKEWNCVERLVIRG